MLGFTTSFKNINKCKGGNSDSMVLNGPYRLSNVWVA